ncbi:MAG: Ubiquinone biosynthesis O-methyltransferase [Myxococcota bacterium]|nr:Ubiquinone biosynthesis O-methyltransferase [Myxococcota bacterium]
MTTFKRMTPKVLPYYLREPPGVIAKILVRLATCPFEEVAARLPLRGSLLDVGCGAGIFTATAAQMGFSCVGVDVDPRKIETARRATRGAAMLEWIRNTGPVHTPRLRKADDLPVEYVLLQPEELYSPGDRRFDAVVINDVLHLVEPRRREDFLRHYRGLLAHRGRMLIKTMREDAGWRIRIHQAQETIMVKGLRWTAGASTEPPPIRWLTDTLSAMNLSVRVEDISEGYPYPHVLVTAEDAPG